MELIDRIAGVLTPEEKSRIVGAPAPAPVVVPAPTVTFPIHIRDVGIQGHEYATFYLGNVDHRAFLIFYRGGAIGLHKTDGTLHQMMPGRINHGCQPRWLRKKPTCFVYLWLNEIHMFDVQDNSDTLLRRFTEFPNVNGMGESGISEDDNHLVLCCGQEVFVYEISTDRQISHFVAPYLFDCLYVSPENKAIVGFYGHGMQIYDGHTLLQLTAALGHQAV